MKKKKRKSTKGILRGPLKQDKSSKARRSRSKGRKYEQQIAQFYRDLGFKDVKRSLQSRAGYEGSDVQGAPWWVECKHYAKVGVARWWEQAVRDVAKSNLKEIVLHIKETNGPEFVVISKEMWAEIIIGSSSYGNNICVPCRQRPSPPAPRVPASR